MKKFLALLLAAALLCAPASAFETLAADAITIPVPSAVLMEKTTGQVIYEKNAHEKTQPASVTKVMTLLLIMEALDAGTLSEDDMVAGSAHAAGMGGSQIWLEEGEQLSVRDMLKAVAVVSANDCAVALAEHIAGSEEAFVAKMNEKAKALGMENTNFTNCTGLFDDANHYTTAYDMALASRALIAHDKIKEYTTIWMDTLRDGKSMLAATNRLIYYYKGATGLKTGWTSQAGYCICATADREGVEYIAVIMKGASSDDRFESAKTLLNYAFANYALIPLRPDTALPPVPVKLGSADSVQPVVQGNEAILTENAKGKDLSYQINLPESVTAPVAQGQKLGTLTVRSGEEILAELPLVSADPIVRLSCWQVYMGLIQLMTGGK